MPIANYTTKVSAARTVSEIQTLLGAKGARHVGIEYEDGIPVGVTFSLAVGEQLVAYQLGVNVAGCLRALQRDKVERRYQTEEHAQRVAWRHLLMMIQAAIAYVDAGQMSMAQIFLGQAVQSDGRTMYQVYEGQLQLMQKGE